MRLKSKRALVTGGARGLGAAFVRALLAEGATVAFTYRESYDEAMQLLGDAGQGFALCCDVRDPNSVALTVAEVTAELGGLDLLINNAGAFESVALEEITVEQWDAIHETNTRGPFLFAREAYPHLKAARGRIVNIGSLGGLQPWATHGHYCASKAALHMLTQVMAKAWASEVSVNCIAPGMIPEEESAESMRFATRTPMGRNGTPQDAVEAMLFFATATPFITGQVLAVDGGLGL